LAGFQVIMYGRFWVFTEATAPRTIGAMLAFVRSGITLA
jgi:hypothetical protein